MEKLCGSLKAELVSTVDTLRRRSIHVLTITNLSTRDRIIDIADCLLPDLDVTANTLEISRPDKRHLTLRARGMDRQPWEGTCIQVDATDWSRIDQKAVAAQIRAYMDKE